MKTIICMIKVMCDFSDLVLGTHAVTMHCMVYSFIHNNYIFTSLSAKSESHDSKDCSTWLVRVLVTPATW